MATPVTFEGCFGWLHWAPGRRGAVLCGAFGHEETSSHRLWRELACRLAAAGVPTLRFDYQGTGDSVGSDEDPGRLAAWQGSIRAAARFLRQHSPATEVTLVGLRLGGLLAALAAQEIDGVEGLALLAPPRTGRSYLREMRARSRVAETFVATPTVPAEWQDDLEACGQVFTGETCAALGALELSRLAGPPVRRILLLHRSDGAADPATADHLRQWGATVEEGRFDSGELIPRAPHQARTPAELFATVADWVSAGLERADAKAPAISPIPMAVAPDVVETPLRFGPNEALAGVLCQRREVSASTANRRRGLIFLNSGANHHIGIARLSVSLARRAAAVGIPSLRFDLGGVGDSESVPGRADHQSFPAGARVDVKAAMDLMAARGYGESVLVGLCSGAHLAYQTALQDSRVKELILFNLPTFQADPRARAAAEAAPGMRSFRYYLQALWCREAWRRLASGQFRPGPLVINMGRRAMAALRARLFGAPEDARIGEAAAQMERLAKRGVRILLMSALEDPGLPEVQQTVKAHGRRGRKEAVSLVVVAGADHNMSQRWVRRRIEQVLERHLFTTPPRAGGTTGGLRAIEEFLP